MLVELDGLHPLDFLHQYLEHHALACKKAAKARLAGSPRFDALSAAYADSNASVNQALRQGGASVAVDGTCNPTDVSIRWHSGRRTHLPANLIDPEVHARLIEEASRLAGLDYRVA